jgi:hypothetical protein
MQRGFVCCNGVLDRALSTNPNCRGNPGVLRSATSLPRTAQARGHQPDKSIVIPVNQRCSAEDRRRRVAINLRNGRDLFAKTVRACRCTMPPRTEPPRIELVPRFEAPRAHSQKTSFVDARARANVLAFSCEAANAMVECS